MYYNPFSSALSAAAAELSSPAARRFYVTRAQQALQTALILIVQFGCLAYALGAQCRQWVEDMEQVAQAPIAIQPPQLQLTPLNCISSMYYTVRVVAIASVTTATLPSFQPIALLSPSPKAKRTRKPSAKGKGGKKPQGAATA